MNPDRGSVVVADLVIGAAIVLILASASAAAGVIIDTGQASREAARSGAVELAWSVEPRAAMRRASRLAPPGAHMEHEFVGDGVRVTAETRIELPHPVLRSVDVDIDVEVEVPIAPYRSRP